MYATATHAAESYILEGIKNKDLSNVPLDPNVIFKGPLNESPLRGVDALRAFLENLYPVIEDARLKHHVCFGDEVCIEWELDISDPPATIPILEYFRLAGGLLVEIRPYYDPRPVTNA